MEGVVHRPNKTEFRECLFLSWTRPYILHLALSASLGGLLFGFDTGVISGVLIYINDDLEAVANNTSSQGSIISSGVAGAILGAALGGWLNDRWGRRTPILIADVLYFTGIMVATSVHAVPGIISGRLGVGLGIGMLSVTSPLYISEASPARIRGALVSLNGLLVIGGQFFGYCTNLAFSLMHIPWWWMLRVACLPALVQFMLMLKLPESPRWLYRMGKEEECIDMMQKIYPAEEVDAEILAMKLAIQADLDEEGPIGSRTVIEKVKSAWSSRIVRRALLAGVGLQIAQQFVGISSVIFYAPTILKLHGFKSNTEVFAVSLIIIGLNAIGSIISIGCVDKYGRRKLLLISMVGIVMSLYGLFWVLSGPTPQIDGISTAHFENSTCPAYATAKNAGSWTCFSCLQNKDCAYCGHPLEKMGPGACLHAIDSSASACLQENRKYYDHGCPHKYGGLALFGLGAYIISYAPGMGIVPWIVNSEIYPLRHRGICGGMAAMANWLSSFIMTKYFLTIYEALGLPKTFFLFACLSCTAMLFIFLFVPETKGLSFEQVEQMLENNSLMYCMRPEDIETKPIKKSSH